MLKHIHIITAMLIFTLAGCASLVATPPRVAAPTLAIPTTPLPTSTPRGIIEVTPSGMDLSGRLIYAEGAAGITVLELAASSATTLFAPPNRAVVTSASLSPDGTKIVMAYEPPPDPGQPQMYSTGIYMINADGQGEPETLQPITTPGDIYFSPTWSADGAMLYYVHFSGAVAQAKGNSGALIERMAVSGGEPEVLAVDALYPRLTPDGTRLVMISFDAQTSYTNIRVANVDGTEAHDLLPNGNTWIIDSLAISPDSQNIVFSMGEETPISMNWLDRFMAWGAGIAQAHSLPSDLWVIPIAGGDPQQVTHLATMGLAPAYAPDGAHIAFLGLEGVYVMGADGTGLVRMVEWPQNGSLQWVR
jgi:Tol biopolymer transport system component